MSTSGLSVDAGAAAAAGVEVPERRLGRRPGSAGPSTSAGDDRDRADLHRGAQHGGRDRARRCRPATRRALRRARPGASSTNAKAASEVERARHEPVVGRERAPRRRGTRWPTARSPRSARRSRNANPVGERRPRPTRRSARRRGTRPRRAPAPTTVENWCPRVDAARARIVVHETVRGQPVPGGVADEQQRRGDHEPAPAETTHDSDRRPSRGGGSRPRGGARRPRSWRARGGTCPVRRTRG